jgi:hypothetical protein
MRRIPVYVPELTAGEFAATHPDHLTLGVRFPGCCLPRDVRMIWRSESLLTILRPRISIKSDLSMKRVNCHYVCTRVPVDRLKVTVRGVLLFFVTDKIHLPYRQSSSWNRFYVRFKLRNRLRS